MSSLTEERKFPRKKSAKLTTVRSLSPATKGPVRIMGFVVESSPGMALIQDIFDDVEKAESILVTVEGTLDVAGKYILFGEVTEKTVSDGKELRLTVSLAYDIKELDVKLYKQSLEMEAEVVRALSR